MRRIAITGARLLDPASGLDAPGGLLIEGERIADLAPGCSRRGCPKMPR